MKKRCTTILLSFLLAVSGSVWTGAGELSDGTEQSTLGEEALEEAAANPEEESLEPGGEVTEEVPQVEAPGEEISDDINTESGVCGQNGANLTWTRKDGVVTISGTGAMKNFDNDDSPFDGLEFTSAVISAGVTTIGNNAFGNCTEITSVSISSTVTGIGSYAFQECSSLEAVSIPASVGSIGEGAFNGCTSLRNLSIEGNSIVGEMAFAECGLTTVSMPKVTEVGASAFLNCADLTTLEVSSVQTIGAWAFLGNTSLRSVKLPKIETVNNYGFAGCTALEEITLGSQLQSIEFGAFAQCPRITGVIYLGSKEQWNAVEIAEENEGIERASIFNTQKVSAIYRLWNPYTGEHLYTPHASERTVLISKGWRDEGIGWYAPSDKGTEVHRLYHAKDGQHHYTSDQNEIRVLTTEQGWTDEGRVWYSAGKDGAPVYRLFNIRERPEACHHYTMDEHEKNVLAGGKDGWVYEGVCWYSLKSN